jgi:hypothetical protein
MIIIKDVPGLTPRETLEALTDLTDPGDPPIATGYGGFVVDEDLAERFLSAYLVVAGKRPAPAGVVAVVAGADEPTGVVTGADAPTEPKQARTPTRHAGRRKGVA